MKEPKLVQLDKVLYNWFAAMHSERKPVPGPMMIKKACPFYDEMKITCNCTFSEGSDKNYQQELRSVQALSDNLEHLIIWHLLGPIGAALKNSTIHLNSIQHTAHPFISHGCS
jgi:hypothetical protein